MDFTDEDFQGSASQFDMDYLENLESGPAKPDVLSRQSLYVKFDPLVVSPGEHVLPVNECLIDALLTPGKGFAVVQNEENCGTIDSRSQVIFPITNSDACCRYSQDEADEILSTLKKTQEKIEGLKYDDELCALQRELLNIQAVDAQLKSGKGVKSLIKQTHKQDVGELKYQCQQWQTLNKRHERLETIIVNHHEKRKRLVVSQLVESTSAEKSLLSLENSLKDLVQRFLMLSDISSNLEKGQLALIEEINRREAELYQICGVYCKLEKECTFLVDQGNLAHESLQKELASKLAVERVITKKFELQVITLSTENRKKIQDKEQLTKICDELLQELNKN